MFKNDLSGRLDQDFIYILSFMRNSLDAFKKDYQWEERNLTKMWLDKLTNEEYSTVTLKRLRNNYLVRLVTCFQQGILLDPFLSVPPPGHIKPIPLLEKPEANPLWLNELIKEAKEMIPSAGQTTKDCETYISSKVFEENRGACVYVAVSVADEGEVPKWIRIGENLDDNERHIEQIFSRMTMTDKEPDTLKPEQPAEGQAIHEELIEAIDKELANLTTPEWFEPLEDMLKLYMEYTRGTVIAEKALQFTGPKLREFFLTHLRSELKCDFDDRR